MIKKPHNSNHIEDLSVYSSLLGRDRFVYFREMEKSKLVLKHVQFSDLKLSFREAVEIVIQFMDLMLLGVLEEKAVQVSKKIYKIKDSFIFYYISGSEDKKLGFRLLAQKQWFNNFIHFQSLVKSCIKNQYLDRIVPQQRNFKQEWDKWQEMISEPQFYSNITIDESVSQQIHQLITSFSQLELNQNYNPKVRLAKYLITNKIIYYSWQKSSQKNKIQQVSQVLLELYREKIISNLESYEVENTKQGMQEGIFEKFTIKNNVTNHCKFLISIRNNAQNYKAGIDLQTIQKDELHDLARAWIRCEVQFSINEGQNHLLIKTEPFWRIYSQNFVQLEAAFLSSLEPIAQMLIAETKFTYFFDPTRLTFKRWSKKIETGLTLEQKIKITNNFTSIRELILCSLDRQMLIWSTFQRDLQESFMLWSDQSVQKSTKSIQNLCAQLRNSYHYYLMINKANSRK